MAGWVVLDISKDFDRVWHVGLLGSMEFQVRYFALFCLFSEMMASMVLHGKSEREYLVKAGVSQGSILGPTVFLLYINYLLDNVICNITIYADDTTQV